MPRKKWTPKTEVTAALLKSREKRKWQINLRRYVIKKTACPFYAPYFGLDIESLRKWFEFQFVGELNWANFGKSWQFDHLVPVTFFDHSNDQELRLCWNFTNLRVEPFQKNKDRGNRLDVLAAKGYFKEIFEKTHYHICQKMLEKINKLEISEMARTEPQMQFIIEHKSYLEMIENYSSFEFELLNRGRTLEEVQKEIAFLKKFET